ncbi:MAG: hypothetical protein JWL81_1921 [Verrucomicrobiales bacterium]|nr:hypothetical protein [Verrucomicrobiales bacterium]
MTGPALKAVKIRSPFFITLSKFMNDAQYLSGSEDRHSADLGFAAETPGMVMPVGRMSAVQSAHASSPFLADRMSALLSGVSKWSGLAAVLALTSCGSLETAAPPVASLAGSSPSSSGSLGAGRAIYLGKCTKCHSAEPIREHSMADWRGDILPTMNQKAKLSPSEQADLLAYITAVSNTPAVPKS